MDVWNQPLRRSLSSSSRFRIFGMIVVLGLILSEGPPALAQTAPDLVFNDGAVTQTTPALIIRNRVYNQGTAAATSDFTIGFYGSTNLTWDPSDPLICSRTVSDPLAAGAYDPATGSANTDCSNSSAPPGIYYKVIMKIDTGNTVAESQENNNTVPLAATNVPVGPDLMFAVALSVTQDASGITIRDQVYNGGNAAAGLFTVGFYASTDTMLGTGDQLICTRQLTGLAAGALDPPTGTAITTCSNGSVTPGSYYVIAKVDSANAVAESRETNNVQAYTNQHFWFGADLRFPSDIDVAYVGQLVISDQIVNSGTVAAGAFTVAFYASADQTWDAADQLICSRSVAGLPAWALDPPTGRADTTCTNSTVVPGQYYIVAKVDSGNSVAEYNETNNTDATTIVMPIGPDLVMDRIDVRGSGQLDIADRVYNQGNANAGTFNVGFYLSLDSVYQTGNDSPLVDLSGTNPCVRAVSQLGPGGYDGTAVGWDDYITCLVGPSVTPGSYYVIAVADSGSTIAESDESNNTLATSALVTIGPGTVCESITPNSGQVGETVTLFGTGFGASQSGATVLFNGVPATEIVPPWSDTEIHVEVPVGATTGPVNVVRTGPSVGCNFTVITNPVSAVDWDIVNFATPPAMRVGEAKELELWVKNINDTVPVGFTYRIVGTIPDVGVVYDSLPIGPVGQSTGVGETFYDDQLFAAPNHPGKTVFFTLTVTDEDSDIDVANDETYLEPNYTVEFLPPVTHTGQAFTLGSVIPVKFRLVDIATGQPVSPPPTAFLWIGKVTDHQLGQEIPAESVAAPDVGNRFRYVESEAQYHYNWDTSSLSTGTWRLRVDLGDGIDYTIEIDLRP